RPVAAELSIAMVDRSLLRLFQDRLPDIGAFFYNQTRTGAFASEATNTFRYEPRTVPVSQAVVEEAERAAAVSANAADRTGVREGAQCQLGLNVSVPMSAPAPAAAAPARTATGAMMGGMGGGAGRRGETGRVWGRRVEELAVENDKKSTEIRDLQDRLGEQEAKDAGAKNANDVSRLSRKRRAFFEGKAADVQPRERFVETAYWNPSVVTGKDGKARVSFKAPAALSEYRITARGITGADTLAGQTTTALTVRKDFFVDLKVPSALTQGDQPRFLAQVHHRGVQGQLALQLAIYAGGRDDVLRKTLELKGEGVEEVLFEPFEVPEGDTARLT